MALDRYRQKRTPESTPEPFGGSPPAAHDGAGGLFVIQKHAASRLHYDFRLAMDGVLRSWAIPKGPSLDPADKRLAVMVEDHPLDYANFEGLIPKGNYGAGRVIVWDRGEYRALDPPDDAAAAVRSGKLDLELYGYKLRGAFTLVRTRGGPARTSAAGGRSAGGKENWLLIKKRDSFADERDVLAAHPRSVLSGLTVEEIAEPDGVGAEIIRELKLLRAPALRAPLTAESFPPALARLAEQPPEGREWLYELKYDGVRALGIREGSSARINGRSGADFTAQYPEVALALSAMPYERFVLDGEIVAPGPDGRPSFALLQRRIQAAGPSEIARLSLKLPAFYQVFDLLAFGGFDLRPLKLIERKRILKLVVKGDGPLRYCDDYRSDGPLGGAGFLNAAIEAKLEGIVAKRRDAPYPTARSGDWIKIKSPRSSRFVIGGWTDPAGGRTLLGALLLGQFEPDGSLRFVSRAGSGLDDAMLRALHARMKERARSAAPFRSARSGEPAPPRGSHFCAPELVCEVRFSEWTGHGGLRHPVFVRLVDGADPAQCLYQGPDGPSDPETEGGSAAVPAQIAPARASRASAARATEHAVEITNPDKLFWPVEGYTKRALIEYYRAIAPRMLHYLKDRPVVLTRYPDGIAGKSFFQKDAPGFAPAWIRREKIYSPESEREISYFILESAEALAYMANLGTIPIHIWSSRVGSLEHPDWLLFDIDPKGTTTARAVAVAVETGSVLREIGLRPYVKTSGQKGIHVVVGLKPVYTYDQARMFAELASRLVVRRIPREATLEREHSARGGRAYLDYLQLGRGKTIAAPFAVRPVPGAPVSAPLKWTELRTNLNPARFNITTMVARMKRLGADPFLGALEDPQTFDAALKPLEAALRTAAGDK